MFAGPGEPVYVRWVPTLPDWDEDAYRRSLAALAGDRLTVETATAFTAYWEAVLDDAESTGVLGGLERDLLMAEMRHAVCLALGATTKYFSSTASLRVGFKDAR
jgi:hypothetical protein